MSEAASLAPAWAAYGPARRWGLLAILFLVSMSNYVDRHVMSVLIEPIKTEFHASDARMGLLTGFAFAACYALLGIPVARIADRGDRRLVITASLLTWTVMTVLCGQAGSFAALALCRVGVGIGEAGSFPSAQSLIADYFPLRERARALAIFTASSTAGYLIAFGVGARLAASYGWRTAFVALGLPGLLIGLLAWVGLDEPRRRAGPAGRAATGETVWAAFAALARKPTYVMLTVSMILYFMVAYGAVTWFPAYMVRVMRLDLAAAGPGFGAVGAAGAILGTIGGGWLTDTLAARDRRWLAWLPAAVLVLACPFFEFAMRTDSFAVFLALIGVALAGLSGGVPAMFSVLHVICGSGRRAMAVAIAFFFANLIGLGLGPLITGALSDAFSATRGPAGLRDALALSFLVLVPAGITLFLCARTMERDAEA